MVGDNTPMTLSVVMPVYNEARTIKTIVEEMKIASVAISRSSWSTTIPPTAPPS